jgi:glycine C-acetyltransferase
MGKSGAGTGEHFDVQDQIDLYFATFAKSMAGIGAFISGTKEVVSYLRFNLRSQIYAKSLPMAMTIGAIKRLEIIQAHPEYREKLWTIVRALQKGLKEAGLDLGNTESPVTPVFMKCPLDQVTQMLYDLRENYALFCSVVIYPVVPKDVVMLRLIPTSSHSLEDVAYTVTTFREIKKKIENDEYPHEMADFKLK